VVNKRCIKRFALCCRTVVLSVSLSVTLVYCGQTVGRIKMKLGREIDLGPGHIVLDGNPAPPPRKGHSSPRLFGQCLLWSNGRQSHLLLSSCLVLKYSSHFSYSAVGECSVFQSLFVSIQLSFSSVFAVISFTSQPASVKSACSVARRLSSSSSVLCSFLNSLIKSLLVHLSISQPCI